jgi:tetratricopeptide (TPR) repeat protein
MAHSSDARPPQVFVSYSWDDDAHKAWVAKLATRLQNDGANVILDQWHVRLGDQLPQFMETSVRDSDFVLIICTPRYKERVDRRRGGGGYEGHVITAEVFEYSENQRKFIPVLRLGEWKDAAPSWLLGKAFADLRGEPYSDSQYQELKDTLLQLLPEAPPIGPKPAGVVPQPPPPKQLFTVPLPENPFFTGREEVLAELKKTLEKSGIAALSGLGGMGKTQTAAHYAHQHRQHYPWVVWVRAESADTLFADLSQLAGRLALPEREAKEQSVIAEAVLRWLDERERWLLVLDNVEDYGVVRDLARKASSNGHHVIITTQTQALGAIGRQKLLPMEREQGAALLLRRANRLAADAPLSNAEAGEAALAQEISLKVGGLPLALDQAGAYLEETGCGLQDYLTLLRQRFSELAERRGGLDSDHLSVAATFLTSFEKLARQSPAAAELLKAAAFLPPDAIPEEIFTQGAAGFGPLLQEAGSDSLKWNEAIGAAFKFSLVERDTAKKMLSMHRMVQAAARSRMNVEERVQRAEQVVGAVNAAFPHIKFAVWDKCERLVPSAQLCAALVDNYGLSSPEASRLLSQAGYYLTERARHTEAEPLFRRALAMREKLLGRDHTDVAISLNNLAKLLKDTNRLGEAEPLMRRSLEINERTSGSDNPNVATNRNNLALLLKETNRMGEAEPLYRRALEIDERSYGPDHPDVARDLNNLALLLKDTNRLDKAEPLMRRAVQIIEKALGPDDPKLATSLNNLAQLLQATNRLGEAEPLTRRAVAIGEHSYGPDHPELAVWLNNLAQLLKATNRLDEAEPLMRRTVGIFLQFTRNTGHEHPHLQGVIANYETLLKLMGYKKKQIEAKLKEVGASL